MSSASPRPRVSASARLPLFRRRRGLATLEFVMVLPILLCVMALMVNFGTRTSWKIRALSVARNELWSHRFPRDGSAYPRPTYWPASAGMGAGGGAAVPSLDYPQIDQPVVRGPMVGDFGVYSDVLDPTGGMQSGSADLQRTLAMLRSLGTYHLHASAHAFSQNCWQFETKGLHWNRERRSPYLYTLPQTGKQQGLAMQYVNVVAKIFYAPYQADLWPLDTDVDFITYNLRFGWGHGAPDFHPWLGSFCDIEEDQAKSLVDDLINRIQGNKDRHIPSLADTMTQAFIDLYQRVINALTQQLNTVPPPPPAQASAIKQEIAELQQKIKLLQQPLGNP
jgi:polyhydroxyalkanoate synthesis regulator phasin